MCVIIHGVPEQEKETWDQMCSVRLSPIINVPADEISEMIDVKVCQLAVSKHMIPYFDINCFLTDILECSNG